MAILDLCSALKFSTYICVYTKSLPQNKNKWQRLGLDKNISTKYGDVRKHTHLTRMKKPEKFGGVMKIRVCECSVKYVILPKRQRFQVVQV